MTGAVECRYYGRDFTAEEMALLRALIACSTSLSRRALSIEFCRRIGWLKPDGGLKDMMARVTMLAMHRDGLIELPPPRWQRGRLKPIVFGPDTEPPLFSPPTTLDEVRPLEMRAVVHSTREGRLWNEFVARYHYLGYKTLVGAQMRYAAHDRNGWPVAMLGFSTAAWKLAPRDNFIGWTPDKREKNLPLVVDNPRFLILPWIEIPKPRLAHPRHRAPPPAPRLDRALRHHSRADRNLRRDPAIHRRRLPRVGLDPRRDHPGPGPLRQAHGTSPAQKGHLAPPPPKRLATHPQSVESLQGGIGSGEQANKRITISSSPGTRTVTNRGGIAAPRPSQT